MSKKYAILTAAAAGVVGLLATAPTFASTAAQIEGQSSNTAATYDNASGAYPIVTAIGSAPGTVDGYTYTNYAIIAQDSTGSLDLFGHLPGAYVPAVGDGLTAAGTYSPYDSIPEVESLTTLTQESTGNPVPAPLSLTVGQAAAAAGTLPSSELGYYVVLDNVTISQQNSTNTVPGNFPTHANGTYTVSDSTGSIQMYDWASSYSTAGALGGTAVPTGAVDIYGTIDYYSSGGYNEFIPFSITPAPEPATLGLMSLGAMGLLTRRRRRA